MRRAVMIGGLVIMLLAGSAACQKAERQGEDRPIDASPTPTITAGENGNGSETEVADPHHLDLRVQQTEYGFRLVSSSESERTLSSNKTFTSPSVDGKTYTVLLISTTSSEEGGSRMQEHAIVVDPESAAFKQYTLYDAVVDDSYGPSSFAVAYGFVDARNLVYIAAVNDGEEAKDFYYQLNKIDIATGKKTVIAARLPELSSHTHYAKGWMTERKDKLVLNPVHDSLWSIDLHSGEITVTSDLFTSAWPFITIIQSPDGERLWQIDYRSNEYHLYDSSVAELASLPFSEGRTLYPLFIWSPDSEYAVLLDTVSAKETIPELEDRSEYYIYAMERIHAFDKQGKAVGSYGSEPGRYVDALGWANERTLLLERYEWDSAAGEDGGKKNAAYSLLDLKFGQETKLETVSSISMLTNPLQVEQALNSLGGFTGIYMVDQELSLVWRSDESGRWMQGNKKDQLAWVAYRDEERRSTFKEWNVESKTAMTLPLSSDSYDFYLTGSNMQWLVSNHLEYWRIAPYDK